MSVGCTRFSSGRRILVTRPHGRAEGLCRALSDHGLTPLRLPVLTLGPAPDLEALKQVFGRLDRFERVIFVSAAAASGLRRYWPIGRQWPAGAVALAVGRATADAAVEQGFPRPRVPDAGQDSEALLALPELQSVENLNVLIVRGNGGRELLSETLRRRGAHPVYAETYSRGALAQAPAEFLRLGRRGAIDLLTSTSNQTLDGLVAATPAADREWLLRLPLLVSAERQEVHARETGYRGSVRVAASSGDEDMLTAILAA